MSNTAIQVKCPHCHNKQLAQPRSIKKAVRRCVYCGKSFKIYPKDWRDSRIVKWDVEI